MGKQSRLRKSSILSKFFVKNTDEFENHPFNQSRRRQHSKRSGKVNSPDRAKPVTNMQHRKRS